MTNLPQAPASNDIAQTWAALSPGLKSLLTMAPSSSAVLEIISVPAFVEECRQAVPALWEAATRPASKEGVMEVLSRRFTVYQQPERTGPEWADFWRLYIDAVGDIPKAALEAGLVAWGRDPSAEFLPKPGKWRELALTEPNRAARAAERAREAVDRYDREQARKNAPPSIPQENQPRPPATPAEREAVFKMLAEFKGKSFPSARPRPIPPPPIQGEVDEAGITEEMRRRL